VIGGLASVTAFVIGFVPPAQLGHQNELKYAALILAGLLVVGLLPPLAMDRLRKPEWKATAADSASVG
jgi:hypothetical protein